MSSHSKTGIFCAVFTAFLAVLAYILHSYGKGLTSENLGCFRTPNPPPPPPPPPPRTHTRDSHTHTHTDWYRINMPHGTQLCIHSYTHTHTHTHTHTRARTHTHMHAWTHASLTHFFPLQAHAPTHRHSDLPPPPHHPSPPSIVWFCFLYVCSCILTRARFLSSSGLRIRCV